jgi:hypothetical protein
LSFTPVAFLNTYGSGPVTISSRAHETKWEAGWVSLFAPGVIQPWPTYLLSYVASWFGELPRVHAEDAGKYKFDLFKRGEHY